MKSIYVFLDQFSCTLSNISMFVLSSIKAQTKITRSDRQNRAKAAIWHCAEPHKRVFFFFFVFFTRGWPLLHVCLGFDISKELQLAMTDESWRNREPEARPLSLYVCRKRQRQQQQQQQHQRASWSLMKNTVQWNLPMHQQVFENWVFYVPQA